MKLTDEWVDSLIEHSCMVDQMLEYFYNSLIDSYLIVQTPTGFLREGELLKSAQFEWDETHTNAIVERHGEMVILGPDAYKRAELRLVEPETFLEDEEEDE